MNFQNLYHKFIQIFYTASEESKRNADLKSALPGMSRKDLRTLARLIEEESKIKRTDRKGLDDLLEKGQVELPGQNITLGKIYKRNTRDSTEDWCIGMRASIDLDYLASRYARQEGYNLVVAGENPKIILTYDKAIVSRGFELYKSKT